MDVEFVISRIFPRTSLAGYTTRGNCIAGVSGHSFTGKIQRTGTYRRFKEHATVIAPAVAAGRPGDPSRNGLRGRE